MTKEQRKTRAQHLNSLAAAVLTVAASATLSVTFDWWLLAAALLISVALHTVAVSIVK